MPFAIEVRQAAPLDAALMATIHGSCFARSWDETAMAKFIAGPGTLCLTGTVADEVADAAAGFLIARKAADEAELLTLAVSPASRRIGLGRALLACAMARLGASGAKRLFLEVEEGNEAALQLYRSLGAVPVGQRARYYEHGTDAAIFSLAL
jgi:[ribosomal protein S18]-alanine N-acetyltransferase